MATVFEIKRDTETVYGIKTVTGACLWFYDRDSRDEKFLEMQNLRRQFGKLLTQQWGIAKSEKNEKI